MFNTSRHPLVLIIATWALALALTCTEAHAAPAPRLVLPMERTAYFAGEIVPLAITDVPVETVVTLDAVNADGRLRLYQGRAGTILLSTAKLAPGNYALEVDGVAVLPRLTIVSTLRRSAASMQDECEPGAPQIANGLKAEERALASAKHWDNIDRTFRESGLTAVMAPGVGPVGRAGYLDVMARSGALLFVNTDGRPTSFLPVGNDPTEVNGMSQRMILSAQANARYPNFAGFWYGWDTTGYEVGGRRMLITYWQWGEYTQPLRKYIERLDGQKMAEFTRRTGYQPVTPAEYLSYVLSLRKPEIIPAIDLPTKRWLEVIATYTKPMPADERLAFEKRQDAWTSYLMGLYEECYTTYQRNLKETDPALCNTSSVQIDHCPTLQGQYFPSAYAPLDFQYQSTWNDQVGGPDYSYQPLLTQAILAMQRGDKPSWISNTTATIHARAEIPGKMTRVAAHGLVYGSTGIGFALEGFTNLLGGMNANESAWGNIKGKSGEADVLAGKEFLTRFAALGLNGRGDHGVGILFSKSQLGRQSLTQGFGSPHYKALVALTRLGYTPRFVTDEELAAGQANDVKALLIIGQTFPLEARAAAGLSAYQQQGGRIIVDKSTTIALPGAERLPYTFAAAQPGKPHSWGAPNLAAGENDSILMARWYPELATAFQPLLGSTGHAWYTSERGTDSDISLTQLDGGADAKYLVATNDSWVNSQADWYQVTERLLPDEKMTVGKAVYDCTDERTLGTADAITCDLSATTARVYAILPRAIRTMDLRATQSMTTGNDLAVRIAFHDAKGKPLEAVLPFYLALTRPDGQVVQEYYRATTRQGACRLSLPLPSNAPAGTWKLSVRSQLSGQVATLPITVKAKPVVMTAPFTAPAMVVQRTVIEKMLVKGSTVVLPIFASPHAEQLLPIAEEVKKVLAAQGVTVEIRMKPAIAKYWQIFEPTPEQLAENARVDRGEAIGQITRHRMYGIDISGLWDGGMSGYQCRKPLVLLDVTEIKDNPLAESLDGLGILWPTVSPAFPGAGRAVINGVPWAFAPQTNSLVIRSADLDGLLAGAKTLGKLPADILAPGIQTAKAELLRQYQIGGVPTMPTSAGKLTARGLTVTTAPQPFAIAFPDAKPLTPDAVKHPVPAVLPSRAVPGTYTVKQLVPYMFEQGQWIQAGTADFLIPDLRFSDALVLNGDVTQAGTMTVTYEGVFRYSDRTPCWQAQWDDILKLRDQYIPRERRPMSIEVRARNGQVLGTLMPVKREEHEVKLEMMATERGAKPRSQVEEVVLALEGTITLPAGQQALFFIPRNVVDGAFTGLSISAR